LTQEALRLEISEGEEPITLTVRGEEFTIAPGAPVEVALEHQGPRFDGRLGDAPQTGGIRADGTRITAGVPDPVPMEVRQDPYAAWTPTAMTPPGAHADMEEP